MIKWTLQKIVGSKNQRELKRMQPIVDRINELEEGFQKESEEQLMARVEGWQKHLHRYLPLQLPTKRQLEIMGDETVAEVASGLQNRLESRSEFPNLPTSIKTREDIDAGKAAFTEIEDDFPPLRDKYLDAILPEAYASVKSAARRLCGTEVEVVDNMLPWDMVHFDVQLVGGIALHRGMIAEMQTGEGKTLVGTLPVFLNALTGLGVHVVTVNDYLARRDSEWMGAVFKYLGLTVGCIENQQHPITRREQYMSDITYGTNAEFGFDYLRDNGMAESSENQVQRSHYFAIVDEVDSILIDEARTPLIISGPAVVSNTEEYKRYRVVIEQLVKKQNHLCNELATEAKKAIEEKDDEMAGRALFKVKLGQPRNRQFMRFMEDPDTRRLIEKTELSFYQDAQKKDLFAIKEELYFTIDEKGHDADLMEMGREFLSPDEPEAFVIPDLTSAFADVDANPDLSDDQRLAEKENIQSKMDSQGTRVHAISQLLKAYCLYEKDNEYVVKDGKVIIVDENTGREMAGRRWSDGLHQAVEAKENVEVERETQTYATITIQNYFRLYEKLGGMTGTAETEAAEFHDIYDLDVLPIPSHRPNQRKDANDHVFKTRREKFNAVVAKIQECHKEGQPVLVGTASVEASETLGRMLQRAKIPHSVLNAKYHLQEAEIIKAAGQLGSVTVATNMAGRGTDIKLGEGVTSAGGLFVIGTERHQSRRIDRQLRGRCSRQGDPGASQFFISFEDDLMRNFAAADRMTSMMERFGMEDGEALEHKWLNRSVETAQKRVEQMYYRRRKYVLDFDDVMNRQREVVYGYRNQALKSEDPRELIMELLDRVIPAQVTHYMEERDDGQPDFLELLNWVNKTVPLHLTIEEAEFETRDVEGNSTFLLGRIHTAYQRKVEMENPEHLDALERHIILNAIDQKWQEHLYAMDSLREGVQLRAQGQKDPLVEYKMEAYKLFTALMDTIDDGAVHNIFRFTTNREFDSVLADAPQKTSGGDESSMNESNMAVSGSSSQVPESGSGADESGLKLNLPKRRPIAKVGRNEPCSCGSGKKFKQCCGRVSE
ncbi:MAG: preprotein translocase subunit SecA [Akkermansiaceae bacterium]|jgi:preprotein translocase subunit SecA